MLLEAIRSFILSRSIKKNYPKKDKISFNLADVSKSLLIIDIKAIEASVMSSIHKVFQDRNIELHVIGFSREQKDVNKNILQLHKEHFKYNLILDKTIKSHDFLNRSYDMVLVYNPNNSYYINYILSRVSAHIRIGNRKSDLGLYDIIIDTGKENDCYRYVQQTFVLLENLSKNGRDE